MRQASILMPEERAGMMPLQSSPFYNISRNCWQNIFHPSYLIIFLSWIISQYFSSESLSIISNTSTCQSLSPSGLSRVAFLLLYLSSVSAWKQVVWNNISPFIFSFPRNHCHVRTNPYDPYDFYGSLRRFIHLFISSGSFFLDKPSLPSSSRP